MITAIEIENFKGIGKRQRIEFAPITLLFGGNSAGKSTVVHAIHYAKEVLVNHNFDVYGISSTKDALDLGGFESVLHRQDRAETREFSIRIEVDTHERTVFKDGVRLSEKAGLGKLPLIGSPVVTGLEICVSQLDKWEPPYLSSLKVIVDGEEFAQLKATAYQDVYGARENYLAHFNLNHPIVLKHDNGESVLAKLFDITGFECGEPDEETGTYPCPLEDGLDIVPTVGQHFANPCFYLNLNEDATEEVRKLAEVGDDLTDYLHQLLTDVTQEVSEVLRRLCHIGPLRDTPPRGQRQAALKQASWYRGLAAYYQLLDERKYHLGKDKEGFKTLYTLDLEKVLDAPYRVERKGIWISDEFAWGGDSLREASKSHLELRLIDLRNETPVDLAAVGSGISQAIPILVAADDQSLPVVFIEQPELHLHPRHQGNIADALSHGFVGAFSSYDPKPAQENRDEYEGRRCIIETHSEHLLLRLMRRIRETGRAPGHKWTLLSPDKVCVYFVNNSDGEALFQRMPLNENGELVKAWPGGFFEEALEDML